MGDVRTFIADIAVSFVWYTVAAALLGLLTMSAAVHGGATFTFVIWAYGLVTAIPFVVIGTLTASAMGHAMRHHASFPMHLGVQAVHAYVVGANAPRRDRREHAPIVSAAAEAA